MKRKLYLCTLLALGSFQSAFAGDLMEVYRTAATNDTVISKAQAAFLAAEQRTAQSKAQLLPKADLSATVSHSNQEAGSQSDSFKNWGYVVSLSQPLFNRATYDQLDQSDKLKARAEIEFNLAKQNLILRVAEAYFNVLAAQDNLDFAKSEIEANARQLDQTKQRFEVGLIAITDVHEAQAAYDLSLTNEIIAGNELQSSIEALRELTGAYIETFKHLNDELPLATPNPENPDKWGDVALKNNLQVIATQLGLEASREKVKLEQAGHLPTVDLVGRYRYDDSSAFTDESYTDASILLQLNVPLYRGGGTSAKIKEAEQLYNQQFAELEQVRRGVQRSNRDAYNSVIANISQVKALKQGIISTQSSLEASEAGLEVGTRTTVDVLNTRRALYKAQRDHARARYDYLLSTLKLKESAGSLAEDDLSAINKFLN